MINESMELAERLDKHALKSGCNCMDCLNRKKRLIDHRKEEWKFELLMVTEFFSRV